MSKAVLLIQADCGDAQSVREALLHPGDGYFQVEWVTLCSDGLKRLAEEAKPGGQPTNAITAVLVDLFLPDSRGIETFDRLFHLTPEIPILVLSAAQDEDVAKLAVRRGAQDYLLKARLDDYLLPKLRSMVERAAIAEALFEEKERAQVTLNSIGDAVISTDVGGRVSYLNAVAEGMTGWSLEEAVGRPLEEVFRVADATTHEGVQNPMKLALLENKTVGLAANCVLIRRDGSEAAIEDSAAPIHDRRGHVTGAVIVFRDVSMARALSLKMAHLAQHDSLTDLPNRILLDDRLTQALALARRHQKGLALLFLDLDRFKGINDSLGHAIGDRLLQSVAERLLACVRSSDTVSRQGGDEFVILLSDVSQPADAAATAEKILLALSLPYRIDQRDLHLAASIGVVIYPHDGTDAKMLLKHADLAMYRAKDSGRNTYRFFEPDMNGYTADGQSIESGLHRAIERHEFVLHYQPIMGLDSGVLIGVEALIRWRHPQRGLVLPAQFVPLAEESGAIAPIGRWVLHEACGQSREWRDAGLPPLRIAINISTVELRSKGFVEIVGGILEEHRLGPGDLELELTETFLMRDSNSTAAVLQSLSDLGVRIALDDFGTGYSSLSHLKRFPIDTLKIDQSFVRNLATDPDDASIVSAVIGMGKGLQIRVIAEGVETREQLAFLRKRGCPEGQGFYFSRPVSAREFTQLLRRSATRSPVPDGPEAPIPLLGLRG
ncbi:MAG TPA: EAL domain-containing protein [Steroidobacteraceae bacterium]|jgi:diguanylate cyclase (GGDEF)-like protein/PAS domain S-box-containing protein|nr:EAL domain-containing protein [Steroidobacteraceae bacterium]